MQTNVVWAEPVKPPVEKVVLELDLAELEAIILSVNTTAPYDVNAKSKEALWDWKGTNGKRNFSHLVSPLRDAFQEATGRYL